MKSLKILFAVVIGLPIVATVALQLFGAVMVASVAHQVHSGIQDADGKRPIKSKYKVDNAKSDRSWRQGFKALSNIDQLHEYRAVNVTLRVALRELLEPGEAQPQPEFAGVFMKARAPRLGKQECERLTKKLASECTVGRVSTGRERDGKYTVNLVLNFIQKAPFGEVDKAEVHSYQEVNQRLPVSGQTLRVMPSVSGQKREALYAEAALLCERVRSSEGNCAIYRLDVSERDARKSSAVDVAGKVRLSFLQ